MYAGFVQGDASGLARLLLLEFNLISRLQVPDLPYPDPQQIGGSEVGIDPDGEQGRVPWVVCQQLLDGLDVFPLLDGVDLDLITLLGSVLVASLFHFIPSVDILAMF